MARGDILNTTEQLVVEHCYKCGVVFAMAREFRDSCLSKKADRSFWCPAGHIQNYIGESDAARAERFQREARREHQRAETLERSRRAVKGQLTKTKKRIANGVCPCCTRTFVDLQRHMSTQHPDYVNPAGEEES